MEIIFKQKKLCLLCVHGCRGDSRKRYQTVIATAAMISSWAEDGKLVDSLSIYSTRYFASIWLASLCFTRCAIEQKLIDFRAFFLGCVAKNFIYLEVLVLLRCCYVRQNRGCIGQAVCDVFPVDLPGSLLLKLARLQVCPLVVAADHRPLLRVHL